MNRYGQPRREWSAANRKRDAEHNRCRICGTHPAELAHIAGREYDKNEPAVWDEERDGPWRPYRVAPSRVVPLCRDHHRSFDSWKLDLLRAMDADEQAQAVHDLGGILQALERVCPDYNPRRVK